MSLSARFLTLLVLAYRKIFSPLKPACCRFTPTCSAYALEALRIHGALYGSWLIFRRILRCQPFGGSGYDPVPLHRPVFFKSRRTYYAFLFTFFIALSSTCLFCTITEKTKISARVKEEQTLKATQETDVVFEGLENVKHQNLATRFLISCIEFYQEKISPHTGSSCRFNPTCSVYGKQALERFGALKGSWLTFKRILRCNPWGGEGNDPLPEASKSHHHDHQPTQNHRK